MKTLLHIGLIISILLYSIKIIQWIIVCIGIITKREATAAALEVLYPKGFKPWILWVSIAEHLTIYISLIASLVII